MPRSEQSRAKDRARTKAWKKKNRETVRRYQLANWKKNKNRHNAQRAERRARWKSFAASDTESLGDTLAILTRIEAQRPHFRYVTTEGRVFNELWETAEELMLRILQERKP